MKYLFTLGFMMTLLSAQAQVPHALYADKIPNYIAGSNVESSVITGGILRISNVTNPVYTLYLANERNTLAKPMVIIFPGGGYRILAASHEGSDIAHKFNEIGIHAMVVHYRLPDSTRQTEMHLAPLQDGQQAVRVARQHAKMWNVDSTKIGVMGFSAGGHVAASVATHFNNDFTNAADGQNLRPDFQILIYPVISFRSFGHQGSANSLLGRNKTEALITFFSNEEQVNKNTPRAFLVHAADDMAVPLANSLNYTTVLTTNKVAVDLHVMAKGGHGFGLSNKTTDEYWFDRLTTWFKTF